MRYSAILLIYLIAPMGVIHLAAQTTQQASSSAPELISQIEARQFPQEKLGRCDGSAPSSQSFPQAKLKVNPNGNLFIEGSDAKGRMWSAFMETAPVATCEIWQADLNGDGRQDLVVVSFGTNSSGGWDTKLSLLIFDKDGRPFPWQATGNFHLSDAGIQEIAVDSGRPGARVIVPQREGGQSAGYSYAYTAYQVIGDRLLKATGSAWPQFVTPTKLFQERQTASNLSTAASTATTFSRATALIGATDDERRLQISTGELLQEPELLVVDKRDGSRTISFTPHASDLQKLVDIKATVTAIGTNCGTGCEPLLMWART